MRDAGRTVWGIPAAVAALLLLSLLCGGCGGVPLSTMWKLRSFDESDFVELDPAEIRAAIERPDALDIEEESVALKIALGEGEEVETFTIPLHAIASGRSVGSDLPEANEGRTWLVLDVEPDGQKAFRALQDAIRAERDDERGVRIEVAASLGDAQTETKPEEVELEIRLRFDAEDGFFTLYDGTVELGGS